MSVAASQLESSAVMPSRLRRDCSEACKMTEDRIEGAEILAESGWPKNEEAARPNETQISTRSASDELDMPGDTHLGISDTQRWLALVNAQQYETCSSSIRPSFLWDQSLQELEQQNKGRPPRQVATARSRDCACTSTDETAPADSCTCIDTTRSAIHGENVGVWHSVPRRLHIGALAPAPNPPKTPSKTCSCTTPGTFISPLSKWG